MLCCLQVQQDMARRAADANYDSDLEEEEQQEAAQQQQREQEAAGGEEAAAAMKVLAETEKKLKELQEQEERLKVGGAGLLIGVGQGGGGGGELPPVGPTKRTQANSTARSRRQSFIRDIRLNTPIPGGVQCPGTKKHGTCYTSLG